MDVTCTLLRSVSKWELVADKLNTLMLKAKFLTLKGQHIVNGLNCKSAAVLLESLK